MGIIFHQAFRGVDPKGRIYPTSQFYNEDTLEGVALSLKRTRAEIDNLNIAYERAQDRLTEIIEMQKKTSEKYKTLKAKLIDLAEEVDDECDDCECEDGTCDQADKE